MSHRSKGMYITELASEILDDAELQRCSVEVLVLKAARLARLCDETEIMQWLWFERSSYNVADTVSLEYMGHTFRWIDYKEKKGYWGGIADQISAITAYQNQLDVVKSFRPSGDYSMMQLQQQQEKVVALNNFIMQHARIVARVRSLIQEFSFKVFRSRVFTSQAETIFERYQADVDAALREKANDALQKIPHIFDRLSAGDEEAVSHALTTCRRLIEAFANAVYPPSDEKVLLGEQPTDVTERHVKNRLRVYVKQRVPSVSRYDRLNKTLAFLYDRVSAGVHADVDIGEARSIVLQTYLLLGEILSLPEAPITTA